MIQITQEELIKLIQRDTARRETAKKSMRTYQKKKPEKFREASKKYYDKIKDDPAFKEKRRQQYQKYKLKKEEQKQKDLEQNKTY